MYSYIENGKVSEWLNPNLCWITPIGGRLRQTGIAVQTERDLGHTRPPSTPAPVPELAMFDLGLDSKLRACDLVKMRVRDICHGDHVSPRATVM